jgi:hypothetical protein
LTHASAGISFHFRILSRTSLPLTMEKMVVASVHVAQ